MITVPEACVGMEVGVSVEVGSLVSLGLGRVSVGVYVGASVDDGMNGV
jgi:hypothetical protein